MTDSVGAKLFTNNISEAYSEPCLTSKMEIFGNYVNGFRLLVISAKDSILDVWQGSQYASAAMYHNSMNQLTCMNKFSFTTFTLDLN